MFALPEWLDKGLSALNLYKGRWVDITIPLINVQVTIPPFNLRIGDYIRFGLVDVIGHLNDLADDIYVLREWMLRESTALAETLSNLPLLVKAELEEWWQATRTELDSFLSETVASAVSALSQSIEDWESRLVQVGALLTERLETLHETINTFLSSPIDWLEDKIDEAWYGGKDNEP